MSGVAETQCPIFSRCSACKRPKDVASKSSSCQHAHGHMHSSKGFCAHQLCLVVGHQPGVGDCDKRLAQPHGLEEAAGAGVADDEPCASHVAVQVGGVLEDLDAEPVCQLGLVGPPWNQVLRDVNAVPYLQPGMGQWFTSLQCYSTHHSHKGAEHAIHPDQSCAH